MLGCPAHSRFPFNDLRDRSQCRTGSATDRRPTGRQAKNNRHFAK
jgi:hypothetical protein